MPIVPSQCQWFVGIKLSRCIRAHKNRIDCHAYSWASRQDIDWPVLVL